MRPGHYLTFHLLIALITCQSAHILAEDSLYIRDLMSADEYRAAGLNKLNPQEIQALQDWLVRYTTKGAPSPGDAAEIDTTPSASQALPAIQPDNAQLSAAPPDGDKIPVATPDQAVVSAAPAAEVRSMPSKEQETRVIRASITGDFSGWSGESVFRLDNKQVWRQRVKGRFRYTGEERAVEIRRNLFGFYWMTHLATGNAVGVTRIE